MKKTGLKRIKGDKFYTKECVVDKCLQEVSKHVNLKTMLVIEPSAGNGSFINAIKKFTTRYEFYDVEPDHHEITKCDFLELQLMDRVHPICFIGNPPFGRQSSLAIKFIKKCSEVADFICFILPKSFKKESMQKHFPLRFHLLCEFDIQDHGFIINDSSHNVPCVFQIWKKCDIERTITSKQEPKRFSFVKKEDSPDIAFRRVGVNAGTLYEKIHDKSKQSHYFIKFDNTDDRSNYIESLKKLSFPCNNTVGPKSISKQELIIEFNKVL